MKAGVMTGDMNAKELLATTRRRIAELEKELSELRTRAVELEKDMKEARPRAAEKEEAVEMRRPQGGGGLVRSFAARCFGGRPRDASTDVGRGELATPSSLDTGTGGEPAAMSSADVHTGADVPADFRELVDLGAGCHISDTADRGITLGQLRRLTTFIEGHCSRLSWKSTRDQQALQPHATTLYDVVQHIIKPATTPRACSYVELVARQEQPPKWFVSHWWGEPVLRFVSCLTQHAIDRKLRPSTSYWVCAYANNQHDLQDEVGIDPAKSSFRRAMATAMGTISVVDRDAICFTRIWCAYEVWVSLDPTAASSNCKYDIYCALDATRAVGFTDGIAEIDADNGADAQWRHVGGAHAHKAHREAAFPADVVQKACRVKLHEAMASQATDRRCILNAIAGRGLDLQPLATNKNYQIVNNALRWRIGLAAHTAIEEGKVPGVQLGDLEAPESWAGRASAAYLPMCKAYTELGRYALAQSFGERAVKAAECAKDEEIANACSVAGWAMYQNANFEDAVSHLDRALAIRERVLGRKHAHVGEILNKQGLCFWKTREWGRALRCFEEALAIRKEALGEKHSDVGQTLNNMGLLLEDRGERERALRCYEEALAISKEALGEKHPDVGIRLNNMGGLLSDMGERERALRCYVEALAISKEALGERHPDVGKTLNNMAVLLEDMGKRERALRCYEEAVAIRKEALGEKHSDVGRTLSNMAVLLADMGERERALRCNEEALAISKDALGENHPDVGNSWWNLANLHTVCDRHERAAECFAEAARVYALAYGDDHEDTAAARAEAAEARGRAAGGR